ncbi:MAG TPA: hypothetical protein PLW86_18915 [Rhodocyclaceae bacterium]|nr:hypothetical protein [Rhodocyclaceae bacterium]
MFDRPIFTDPLAFEIAGDDPLGLAPTNERLYMAVFPGVNNVVRYIRVYSAICWCVRLIERYLKEHENELTRQQAREIFDQATEKIQLLIAWTNKSFAYPDIAGSNRKFPTSETNQTIRLRFVSFGTSTASLLEAVSYRPSLTSGLRFLEKRSGDTFACTPAGEQLAEAFEKHVCDSQVYDWLADVTQIDTTYTDAMKLKPYFVVGDPSALEQSAFMAQFFPELVSEESDSSSYNRWLSLNLVLRSVDLIAQKKISDGEDGVAYADEVRACMARWRMPGGLALNLAGLQDVHAWWAVLQLRQLYRLAIEVIYCVVERWLGAAAIDSVDTSIAACSEALAGNAVQALDDSMCAQVQQAIDTFVAGCDGFESLYEAYCNNSDTETLDVFYYIKELRQKDLLGFDKDGSHKALASAYVALIFCAVEAEKLYVRPETKSVLQKDEDDCSLISLMHLVRRMAAGSPHTFIAHLVKHWVVLRHFDVVSARSERADGRNRFRFVVGDEGLERFDPTASLPFPAFAEDRLKHILILCRQAGFLDGGGAYKLSALGRRRIETALRAV